MLFHTLPFWIFLLVVLPIFYALRRTPFWIPWLLAASYFFYGWWTPYSLLLIASSTPLDYLLVTLMARCPLPGRPSLTPPPPLPEFPSRPLSRAPGSAGEGEQFTPSPPHP